MAKEPENIVPNQPTQAPAQPAEAKGFYSDDPIVDPIQFQPGGFTANMLATSAKDHIKIALAEITAAISTIESKVQNLAEVGEDRVKSEYSDMINTYYKSLKYTIAALVCSLGMVALTAVILVKHL